MSQVTRIYKGKDVEMLLSTATIMDSAIANKDFLQTKRSNWSDPYLQELRSRIDIVIETHLGIDSAAALRNATVEVLSIQAAALKDLAELKVQITEDFKKDPSRLNEILNQLGYNSFYAGAKSRDQEALINLLYQYGTNLTAGLKAELMGKGISKDLLESIALHSGNLKDNNIRQEGKKAIKKIITAESITAFNDIYSEVISIANISKNFFLGNNALKDQFSYSKVRKAQNSFRQPEPAAP